MSRALIFTIAWDSSRRSFAVRDEGGYLLGQSPDREKALALAIKDAELAARSGARVSIFSKAMTGKMRREWTCEARPGTDPASEAL
jgi:hypothetical protein